MGKGKKLEWDIRKERIKQIAIWVNNEEEALRDVLKSRSVDEIEDWFAEARTLWMSIKVYLDEENQDKKENVQELMENFDKKDTGTISFDEIQELHDKVHEIRVNKLGLDIPMSAEDEESVEDFYL